uniref:Uncharacterized protein n=1 Tax=Ditylenchus dipsaci TaxID=166011 RepID=A0A915EN78_9BILA
MAYAPNYYNYQVAVIFAIMLGGMLLLAMVIGAIYFICVVNMRNKKGINRTPSGVDRGRAVVWQPAPVMTHTQQQPYSSLHSGQQQQYDQKQNPNFMPAEYDVRQPVNTPYTTTGYNNQPLVQQYPGPEGARIRELQPEYAYQQGPTTWTTMSPAIREDNHVGSATGYHMSSV